MGAIRANEYIPGVDGAICSCNLSAIGKVVDRGDAFVGEKGGFNCDVIIEGLEQ